MIYWPETIPTPAPQHLERIPDTWAIMPTPQEIERQRIMAVLAPRNNQPRSK